VNVCRLAAVTRVEEEPERTHSDTVGMCPCYTDQVRRSIGA
jgi:hypothetical protein